MLKKLNPKWEEAIAVAVISAQEYEATLEQLEDLILYAAYNDVDIVEIPQEDVELRKIITIQTEQGLYSNYTLKAIQEYLKGFVASDVIAPAGRYALTCKDIAEMYNGDVLKQHYFFGYPLDWHGKMSVKTAKEILFCYSNKYENAIPSAKAEAIRRIKEYVEDLEYNLNKLRELKVFFQNL